MYEILKSFKAYFEKFSGNKINVLRNDNGKEYVNNKIQHLCEDNGIQMKQLVPYMPHQNGVVEHKNIALKQMDRCMLEDKYLYPKIWNESINYDSHVYNRVPHK